MSLTTHTRALRNDGRKALVAFLTAGYPDEETFTDAVTACADAGCDIVEIGVPFSDPIADGPVIQAASTAALRAGMSLKRALGLAASLAPRIKSRLVIMSYINPIIAYGMERFAADAEAASVRGVILPDVSLEESGAAREVFTAASLDYVDLLAPTSSDERIALVAQRARGFLYLVSVTGVTGAREALPEELERFVARVREHTETPAYVGFGVSTAEQAARVSAVADGVIIGSQLIRILDDGPEKAAPIRLRRFLSDVRTAIDAS